MKRRSFIKWTVGFLLFPMSARLPTGPSTSVKMIGLGVGPAKRGTIDNPCATIDEAFGMLDGSGGTLFVMAPKSIIIIGNSNPKQQA